jgi:hypothetical protein
VGVNVQYSNKQVVQDVCLLFPTENSSLLLPLLLMGLLLPKLLRWMWYCMVLLQARYLP